MKEHIKQIFYLLDTSTKKTLPILIFFFLLSSLLDVIGIGLIGGFLGLLTDPHYFAKKLPFLHFLNNFSETKFIIFAGIFIVSAFIIKAIITILIQAKVVFFCQSLLVRLRMKMMRAYQQAPYIYHVQKNSAYLISRLQDNITQAINNVLLPLLNFISNLLITFSILLFLLFLHPILTLCLASMFLAIGLIFDSAVKRKLSAAGKIVAVSQGMMIKSIHHGLHGLTEIRVLGKENYFLNSLKKVSLEYVHAVGILTILQQIPRYLVENMIAIFIITLSLVGLLLGFKAATIVEMGGMFAAAGVRLLPTMTQMMGALNQIRGYFHHVKLISLEFAELDTLIKQSSGERATNAATFKLPFSEISLKQVDYTYPVAKQASLADINLTFLKGQSIGLVGASGAGKSTLVNLILGFLEPEKGVVLVDGKPILNIHSWLNNFAYIPQSIFLLDDTLRRNIAFGVEDENINDEQIWHVINMAQLNEVVTQLPNGLDTFIGENGIRLSGGQRQRVALARAFYHERDIIVLDEATSSLDHETEREVIDTIKRLKGNKTLIVIAHRLTTVEHCDILYRLDHGRIAAVGTFKEVVGEV